MSEDLAGAGRSGIVTDKVTKFPALDQQVWQMRDFPLKAKLFAQDLVERDYSRARTEDLGSSSIGANRWTVRTQEVLVG